MTSPGFQVSQEYPVLSSLNQSRFRDFCLKPNFSILCEFKSQQQTDGNFGFNLSVKSGLPRFLIYIKSLFSTCVPYTNVIEMNSFYSECEHENSFHEIEAVIILFLRNLDESVKCSLRTFSHLLHFSYFNSCLCLPRAEERWKYFKH